MAHSVIDAYTAIQRMDVAAVTQAAQQGAYGDDMPLVSYQEGPFRYRVPALALAIRWANNPRAPPDAFAGVLNALVARRGAAILSAPLDIWLQSTRFTMTPLTLLLTRRMALQAETPLQVGRTLRTLLEAGADATAPTLYLARGEPQRGYPPLSLLAEVLAHYHPHDLPHVLLPLLQHGARRLPDLDPPSAWFRGRGARYPEGAVALVVDFLCVYAQRPGLVQYVRDCNENLLEFFVDRVGPAWHRAPPGEARDCVRTLCETYGFEITDALLARATSIAAAVAHLATARRPEAQAVAHSTRTVLHALEAERGDRRVEAIQLQRALVSRRGLPPEIAHAILRAAGGARPASGAAEWNAAHPPPRLGDNNNNDIIMADDGDDEAARAAASVAAWRAAHTTHNNTAA